MPAKRLDLWVGPTGVSGPPAGSTRPNASVPSSLARMPASRYSVLSSASAGNLCAGMCGSSGLAFAEELALSQATEDDAGAATIQAWETVYERIAETMTLVAPSGPVAEFLLHIDGSEAWFRWSDEPFTDE